MRAVISVKTTDEPKIYPTQTGARIEFEIYEADLNYFRSLVGEELEIEIRKAYERKSTE